MRNDGYHYHTTGLYQGELSCWNCGQPGSWLSSGFLICPECDVRWTRWARPLTIMGRVPAYM